MAIQALNYPKQRLSYKEKVRNNYKWCRDMIDTLILSHVSGETSDNQNNHYERMLANYQLYNNTLNQKDFERECNPLGIEVGQFKDEIQPYNKTYNKIQVLLGEELKRPVDYKTVIVNSEGVRTKLHEKDEALRTLLAQHVQQFQEKLLSNRITPDMTPQQARQAQQEIQQAIQQAIPEDQLEKLQSASFSSTLERLANQILQYLILDQSVKEKMNDAFKHALISGEEHTWVGIRNGQTVIEPLNPLGIFYHKSPEVKYVQDGLFAGYRTMMSVGDILDRYSEYLEDEDINQLEEYKAGILGTRDSLSTQMKYDNTDVYEQYITNGHSKTEGQGSYGSSYYGKDWIVTHVEWRSERKVYFIEFTNNYGDTEKVIASEDFEIPDYATKSTETNEYGKKKKVYTFDNFKAYEGWIPEIWEGVRIGGNIYCCMGPKKYQHRSIDNPYKARLGYHGIVYNNMNAQSISLMDRMKPFQYIYFVLVHKLKRLIARDKGKVFHFDTSMIPEKLGLLQIDQICNIYRITLFLWMLLINKYQM